MRKTSCAIVLSAILVLAMGLSAVMAEEYDMTRGNVRVKFTQHNPITVSVRDGKNATVVTNFSTEVYDKLTSLSSEGSINFTEGILASDSALKALFEDGNFSSVIEEGDSENSVSINGKNGLTSVRIEYSSGKEAESKQVATTIRTTEAEKGTLEVNHDNPDLSSPTSVQQLSQSLNISTSDARGLIKEYGRSQVSYMLDGLNNRSRNGSGNGNNSVVGGAGGMADGGAVDIQTLNSGSYFQVLLDGVRVAGRLMDPAVQVKILHPGEDVELKGFYPTVTVVQVDENGSGKNVVLMENIPFNEDKGFYYLDFRKVDWLVDYDDLPVGFYKVFLDIGRDKKVTLGARITESGKLVPAK
ncbi:MAG: hypothetical protein ACOC82_02405 [Candidatus Bipolaricaulota bacterium]